MKLEVEALASRKLLCYFYMNRKISFPNIKFIYIALNENRKKNTAHRTD